MEAMVFLGVSLLSLGCVHNERQITHLIGAQPVLESYEIFWWFWIFSVEIAQGISKKICYYCNTKKEKGEEKKGKLEPPPPPKNKNHIERFLGGHGLDE